jgi:[ribosomal protein S5]-alanine N-acetyltransferase
LFDIQTFPHLQTKRLLLREIILEDAPAVFAFRSDPEVQRYNGGALTHLDQASELIAQLAAGYRQQTMLEWGVTLQGGDDTVLGLFGYANWSQLHRRAEIGYCLRRDYWRQGIGCEALRTIMAFGFHAMDLNRIHACPWSENAASVRLLEKLGFQREGLLRDEYLKDGAFHDETLYALLRREYLSLPDASQSWSGNG